MLEAYQNGHRHFGENYVQELLSKAKELVGVTNSYFLGRLVCNMVLRLSCFFLGRVLS